MKFSISTMLMLTLVVCLGLGWVVDRRNMRATIKEDRSRVWDEAYAMHWSASTKNVLWYHEIVTKPREELDRLFTRQLVVHVVILCDYENDVDDWLYKRSDRNTHGTATSLARDLLVRLDCSSHLNFVALVSSHLPDTHDRYVDPTTEQYKKLKTFVEKSL